MIQADLRTMVILLIGCMVGYGIYSLQRWLKLLEKPKKPQAS